MKKKILVLQFRTDKSLKHERDCIVKSVSVKKSELLFINVLDSRSKLPDINSLENYAGIIMGGSGQVDISGWSDIDKAKIARVKILIKRVVSDDMPMLNICFGHQLLAYFLGGRIEADVNQAETGTYKITLNEKGKKSPLFQGIPEEFFAVLGHKDSVIKMPPGATMLASSKRCKVQAYKIKNNIYAVQFHPELDKDGMRYRLKLFPDYNKGKDIEKLLKNYKETQYASAVVKNFTSYILPFTSQTP